jgi:hypothetical protein
MTDFDRLGAAAAELNRDPELGVEQVIEPHWSDDRTFTSEQQYKDYKAGLIPYPGLNTSDNLVFLGYEEGNVAIYVDRDKMNAEYHMQQLDHIRREAAEYAAHAMYHLKKELKK